MTLFIKDAYAAFERLKQSNMWCERYHLPLSGYYKGSEGPQNNNPWFYLACAVKLLKYHDKEIPFEIVYQLTTHLNACEHDDKPGLFDRWPKQAADDVTSHDELIGIAYLNQFAAEKILDYLQANDGVYINSPIAAKRAFMGGAVEWDLSRFTWFMSYLKARAETTLSPLSQLKFSAHVLWDMLRVDPNDAAGRLHIWLMSEHMENYPLCKPVIVAWRERMNRMGLSPKAMFRLEPKENPIMSELAPDHF